MKRLFVQIYLTLIASLIVLVLAAGAAWRLLSDASPAAGAFQFAGEIASAVLPEASAPRQEQAEALTRIGEKLEADVALYSADLELIAATGLPLPPPEDFRKTGGWMHRGGGRVWSIALPDGRWVVMRGPKRGPPHRHPAFGIVGVLSGLALAVAAGVYPVVRRLTRRLETLNAGVTALGAGDLSVRVAEQGSDEVAALARNFNRAAQRIEELVGAHKMLLANASHELRTPLSRIRLGLELLKEKPDAARYAALEKDVSELDEMIGEILLSSRLEALDGLEAREEIDLLGLTAEESARYGVALDGMPAMVTGDPRLLRRLVRNLIENAMRHGKPPVSVSVVASAGTAVLTVADHGSGVPNELGADVFKPFRRAAGNDDAQSTGLGLALVAQIASRHGGTAAYATRPEGGSRFTVTLPLATTA